MQSYLKSHDLGLPDWGPYSKRYAGISHIPDVRSGLRFDVAVVPGYYRRQMLIPNENWASGYHAWDAATDLTYYSYRYEIEWKDQVYCDVSFSALSDKARLIRCAFVNNTAQPQSLMLHLLGCMNFPTVRVNSQEVLRPMTVTLPEGGVWIDALDYDNLQFAVERPTDNLVYDGMMRAEIRADGLVGGRGIGDGFGRDAGDWVSYHVHLEQPLSEPILVLRYRVQGQATTMRFSDMIDVTLNLTSNTSDGFGFSQIAVSLPSLAQGQHTLTLTSAGDGAVEIDGFVLVPSALVGEVKFMEHLWSPIPEITHGQASNQLLLQYADTDLIYGIAWDKIETRVRQLFHHELDTFLRHLVPDNEILNAYGSREGHFTDIWMRPLFLAPHSQQTVMSVVCSGTRQQVEETLATFAVNSRAHYNAHYNAARSKSFSVNCLPSGERYRFSQERMAATEMLNVVYPVYTQRQYIRHHTPGKWWDSLYTWDSGFIGLALLELDIRRAIENLNAYVTNEGNSHAAFIHHGSPVPVQIYLFQELWNRTQDRALLEWFYPALRQYYRFLAGHAGSSTTRALRSNLLRTWEYFDDSAGWDDYPAQIHVWEHPQKHLITCAAITAHVIRSAKTLLAAATTLGLSDDVQFYEQDIRMFSDALQKHSWDAEAGYFSYVLHDDTLQAKQVFRHESGLNFNMGLDGVMPLFAGICTPEQETRLLEKLESPRHFWTPIGLSTIDQSAPYYRQDGYWNGAVWMPHQWFMWKTALDLAQGEFAYQIAKTALDLWQQETETSYYCFEHFIIGTGRGAGWHQFSGLSSPVVSWFNAYHKVGRLTTGMNIWVEKQEFKDEYRRFDAHLRHISTPRPATIIVNMQPQTDYKVTWNGTSLEYYEIHAGCLQIVLPFETPQGNLVIARA